MPASLTKKFNEILNDAINPDGSSFSFEAGREKYVHMNFDPDDPDTIIPVLRGELNINLDRITALHNKDDQPVKKFFRGCFAEWSDKYKKQLSPLSTEEEKNLERINKLLNGRYHSFWGILDIFRQTILRTSGVILWSKAGQIVLGVGLGIFAQAGIWLSGLPFGLISSLVMTGVILFFLGRSFKKLDIMSGCIRIAYGMLDKRSCSFP